MLSKNSYLKDWENRGFLAVMVILAVYYGYRMFALTPWYDELYTYYCFISHGPIYGAIHWPLPNNHVGYSVLSGFLDLFGNPVIGLRGVSYCCALANVWLIYTIGRRHFKSWWSLCTVAVYFSMNLVNQLAVQGRGYTLAVTCYLTALWMMDMICLDEKVAKKHYIIFALSLTLGLYTVPSSVYWVVPLCLAGGIYLLCSKRISTLIRLIISAVSGAVMTAGLYTVIWLAIGSNLLSKDREAGFLGQTHLKIIVSAPFQAIKAGIDYMLSTPYIQSVEGGGFIAKLYQWFQTLFAYMQNNGGIVILVVVLVGSIVLTIGLLQKSREQERFLSIYMLIGIWMLPVLLIIQHTLPYYRVFSFVGVLLAFLFIAVLQKNWAIWAKKITLKDSQGMVVGVIMVLGFVRLFSPDYNTQYAMREYEIQDALEHSAIAQAGNPCVTDCTQQYLIKYLYKIECENQEINDCDFLLLDKKMADPDFDGFEWEFYHTYETIPWDYVEGSLEKTYENETFILYERKSAEDK